MMMMRMAILSIFGILLALLLVGVCYVANLIANAIAFGQWFNLVISFGVLVVVMTVFCDSIHYRSWASRRRRPHIEIMILSYLELEESMTLEQIRVKLVIEMRDYFDYGPYVTRRVMDQMISAGLVEIVDPPKTAANRDIHYRSTHAATAEFLAAGYMVEHMMIRHGVHPKHGCGRASECKCLCGRRKRTESLN